MTFQDEVHVFLRLCDAAIRGHDGLGTEFSVDNLADVIRRGPSDEESAMRSHLDGLAAAIVLKLQTLMYCGRDDRWDVDEFQQELDDGKSDAVRTIMQKMPDNVAKYLRDGISLLKQHNVDLERNWHATGGKA